MDGIVLSCSVCITAFTGFVTIFEYGKSGDNRCGILATANKIYGFVVDDDGKSWEGTTPLTYLDEEISIKLSLKDGEQQLWINDSLILSGTESLNLVGTNNYCYLGSREGSIPFKGRFWDCKLNDGVDLNLPLQGSIYDISGNGNHGTNNGCDLTSIQDIFHYNLREGFGEGVSSDFIPRLADDSGFPATVTAEHLAGTWNNMPESYFRFSAALTDNIMDKSDVGIWSADVRASTHYDSSNPTDWNSSELTTEYFNANISPAYKDRVFIADDNTDYIKDGDMWLMDGDDFLVEYGDEAKQSKQMLVYSVAQTGSALRKLVKFLEKQY